MAKDGPRVRVRRRPGKRKQKNFGTSWPIVKQVYVTGEMPMRELAERFNIPERTLFSRSKVEGWVDARHAHQVQIAAELQQEMVETTLTYRVNMAKAIRGLKKTGLANLQRKLDGGEALKAKDLEILTRLEMDLMEPGWSKSDAEKNGAGTTVNVAIGLETTVLEALGQRGLIETSGASKPAADVDDLSDTRPDKAITDFLYSDGGSSKPNKS